MYGFKETGSLTQQGSGLKFGLNTGYITKFEYNPNGGKDGAAADCVDLTVMIGDRELRQRFYEPTKVYGPNGEITDTNSEDYKKGIQNQTELLSQLLCDIASVFLTQDILKEVLSTPINSFKQFAELITRAVTNVPDWNKTKVDVFLQYQSAPKGTNTVTFLELPNYAKSKITNTYHGLYICKHVEGDFKEDRTESHLRYINENNEEHPFKRGSWYVNSTFAKQVRLEDQPSNTSNDNPFDNNEGEAVGEPVW